MPDLNFNKDGFSPINKVRMQVREGYIPAAVLVLIFERRGEHWIVLTRRTLNVRHHKGEISFPGGRMDKSDVDLLKTAIRETFEEIGIEVKKEDVFGQLKDSPTTTGYIIRPFLASLEYPYDPTPSSNEVSEILEMPFRSLGDYTKIRDEARLIHNKVKSSHNYVFDGHVVHGATARILADLFQMVGSLSDH